jgi:hypothetical protein
MMKTLYSLILLTIISGCSTMDYKFNDEHKNAMNRLDKRPYSEPKDLR